jgi:hypothetical protein
LSAQQEAYAPREAALRDLPSQPEVTRTAVWTAAVLTAAVVLLAMVLLGQPLGKLLPSGGARFWSTISWFAQPEPTEQARYLLALTAPVVLVALTVRLVHQSLLRTGTVTQGWATAIEVLAVAGLVLSLVLQRTAVFSISHALRPHITYFTWSSLVAAAVLTVAIVGVVRQEQAVRRIRRWTAESPRRALVAGAVAVVAVAITVLPAIAPDASIRSASIEFVSHARFTYDETAAILDGRTPLVDFAAQYASLWPYVTALAIWPFDGSFGVFTVSMAVLIAVALLALFALLRRITGSALLALALFLPLMATSAFRLHDETVARFSLVNYFGTMPLRYAGPFVLAWLVARHIDGVRPRRAHVVFAVAGLVAINNPEFGIPALGATIAALLTCERPTRRGVRALAVELALGLTVAAGLVTALALVRTGALPEPSLALRYPRLFASSGFGMVPIHPQIGMSTVIYLTYVAAIGTATVLALRRTRERTLIGMLAWSGVFGLGIGSYYVGRSIAEVLINMFPAWALAVTLLTVVVVRDLADDRARWPRPIELACLFGFGLLVCSLAQTPSPVAQGRRIASDGQPFFRHPPAEAFVAEYSKPGERIVVIASLGHRIAYNLGVDDVTPYTGSESIQTEEQLDDTLESLRAAGGYKLFVEHDETSGVSGSLAMRGARSIATSPEGRFELWFTR